MKAFPAVRNPGMTGNFEAAPAAGAAVMGAALLLQTQLVTAVGRGRETLRRPAHLVLAATGLLSTIFHWSEAT